MDSIENESSGVSDLERQLEHSSYYSQTVLSQYANRINELEAFIYGLIDFLIEKKILNADDLQANVQKIRDEIKEKGDALHAGIALRIDRNAGAENFVPVNCSERIHICKAICCKLNFALAANEVDSGKIKWDLGRPYFIRHEKTGYCTHLNGEQKCCSVYKDRPGVCTKYSCAKDTRIWKNFEEMELNEEWINENLNNQEPRLFLMDIYEKIN